MTRTVIHLLRHGEVHNPEGILYGRLPDYHLSDLGKQMARRATDHLIAQSTDLRYIACSPLERAVETASPAVQAYGLPLHVDARLIEAENSFEGMAVNRRRRALANPRYWWRYRNPWQPSWGEPYSHIAQRMSAAVQAALPQAEGGEALLVSHQSPIWCLRLFIERRSVAHLPVHRQCALASLTSLHFVDRRLVGWSYYEPSHDLLRRAADMVPGTTSAQTR